MTGPFPKAAATAVVLVLAAAHPVAAQGIFEQLGQRLSDAIAPGVRPVPRLRQDTYAQISGELYHRGVPPQSVPLVMQALAMALTTGQAQSANTGDVTGSAMAAGPLQGGCRSASLGLGRAGRGAEVSLFAPFCFDAGAGGWVTRGGGMNGTMQAMAAIPTARPELPPRTAQTVPHPLPAPLTPQTSRQAQARPQAAPVAPWQAPLPPTPQTRAQAAPVAPVSSALPTPAPPPVTAPVVVQEPPRSAPPPPVVAQDASRSVPVPEPVHTAPPQPAAPAPVVEAPTTPAPPKRKVNTDL